MSDAHHAPEPDDFSPGEGTAAFGAALRGRGGAGWLLWWALIAGLIILLSLLATRCDDDDTDAGAGATAADDGTDTGTDDTAADDGGATDDTAADGGTDTGTDDAGAGADDGADAVLVASEATIDTAQEESTAVVVSGTVADEATADGVRTLASLLAGDRAIVDELEVADDRTDDGGTLTILGATDEATLASLDAGIADLEASGLTVDTSQLEVVAREPSAVTLELLAGGGVTLTGQVPDDATRTTLVDGAAALTGDAALVDDQLEVTDAVTNDDGTLTVVGTVPSDADATALTDALAGLGLPHELDTAQLAVAGGGEAVLTIGEGGVTLQGVVASDEARAGLVDVATGFAGFGNVTDELAVDTSLDPAAGALRVEGSTDEASATELEGALAPLGFQLDLAGLERTTAEDVTAELNQIFLLEPIQFETGSAAIRAESTATLDRIAAILTTTPALALIVEGHTDNQGDPAFNLQLSQQRADAVRAYLVAQGIAADRLDAVGRGQDEPIADNATEAGRQQNRRIQFEIA